MTVLVDTSVWIEFFSPRPVIETAGLELLIGEKRVVTCLPVRAELLSGKIRGEKRHVVVRALDSMVYVDPDWGKKETWDELSGLSDLARCEKVGLPGLVDRMIVLAAKKSGSLLWTLDRKLRVFAWAAGLQAEG